MYVYTLAKYSIDVILPFLELLLCISRYSTNRIEKTKKCKRKTCQQIYDRYA